MEEIELYILQISNESGSVEKIMFSLFEFQLSQIDFPENCMMDQILICKKTIRSGDFSMLPLDCWLTRD
jgi:hypothetical protein